MDTLLSSSPDLPYTLSICSSHSVRTVPGTCISQGVARTAAKRGAVCPKNTCNALRMHTTGSSIANGSGRFKRKAVQMAQDVHLAKALQLEMSRDEKRVSASQRCLLGY